MSWEEVVGRIEGLCEKWNIHKGTVRVGGLKDDEAFGRDLGEVWMAWESKTNEWWSEVCGKPKEAGGPLKIGQSCIQDMVKVKKAPEWDGFVAWEWIERRMVEMGATSGTGGVRYRRRKVEPKYLGKHREEGR